MLREQIVNTSESGKAHGDLHQPSGIRYELRSFSVSCFISLAYRKVLISGVKIFVVVPQSIGISLHNRIGDSAREFLVVVIWGFLSAVNDFELLLFLCFCVGSGDMYAW